MNPMATTWKQRSTAVVAGQGPWRRSLIALLALLLIWLSPSRAADLDCWLALSTITVKGPSPVIFAGGRSGSVLATHVKAPKPIWRAGLPQNVTGLALARDPDRLLATVAGGTNLICVLDPATGKVLAHWQAGNGACAPVVSPVDGWLFVCHRFGHAIGVHDLATGVERARIAVLREPIAAAISPDGTILAVANHLPEGATESSSVAAAVTLLDTREMAVRTHVRLPSGSVLLQGIAISPAGTHCAVVHQVARFQVPTTQIEHGWMNASALSLIDLRTASWITTVLLDEVRRGAANPSAVAWNHDGRWLSITHAGTHEVSLIDFPAFQLRLEEHRGGPMITQLDFLRGIRRRVALSGSGPRSLAIAGGRAYIGQFFSDTVSVVDLKAAALIGDLTLGPGTHPNLADEGERWFHDATLSRQGWQSCASCHPEGRADGLNWDLLNDGLGNPKNTKSLVLSHRTPPVMSLGVRASAEKAVRSGFRHILFTPPNETTALAVDAYLKGLRAVPALQRPPESVRRGQRLFESAQVGCAVCHPSPLYTDQARHRVGTDGKRDRVGAGYDTPTLIECWRTAPYLHNGSAATLREVLTTRNSDDQHGKTSHLTTDQLDDLEAFVLSLPDR